MNNKSNKSIFHLRFQKKLSFLFRVRGTREHQVVVINTSKQMGKSKLFLYPYDDTDSSLNLLGSNLD